MSNPLSALLILMKKLIHCHTNLARKNETTSSNSSIHSSLLQNAVLHIDGLKNDPSLSYTLICTYCNHTKRRIRKRFLRFWILELVAIIEKKRRKSSDDRGLKICNVEYSTFIDRLFTLLKNGSRKSIQIIINLELL